MTSTEIKFESFETFKASLHGDWVLYKLYEEQKVLFVHNLCVERIFGEQKIVEKS